MPPTARASFTPAVSYIDYASSVEDILALCMTGFPSFEATSSHRRTLIYLGPRQVREPGERRPSLMTAAQVTDMASKAGIQINALSTPSRGRRCPSVDLEIIRRPILLARGQAGSAQR